MLFHVRRPLAGGACRHRARASAEMAEPGARLAGLGRPRAARTQAKPLYRLLSGFADPSGARIEHAARVGASLAGALRRRADRRIPGHRPAPVRHLPAHLCAARPALSGGRPQTGHLQFPRRRSAHLSPCAPRSQRACNARGESARLRCVDRRLQPYFQRSPQRFYPQRTALRAGGCKRTRTPAVSLPERPRSGFETLSRVDAPGWEALMNKHAAHRAAARACAEEIVRLLESARIGATKLAPGDIAVLVQTRAQGSVMKQILSEWGIGSVELAQTSIFETEDAEAFERVLHAIAAPHDTACLRAALVTDWFEADAHALAQSRRGNALSSDMSHWAESFIRYRTLWQRRGFAALWRILLHEQRIAQRLAAQPFGERRLTSLNHLAEQIQTYAAHALSIAATLRWFSVQRAAQRTGPAPEELRLRLESDRALVRIATVHIAKGLEYAVVFCPFLGDGDLRVASFGGLHHAHEYHDEDGHAVFHYAPGE